MPALQTLLAFIFVTAAIPAAIRLARATGFTDGRKDSGPSVPPVGGLVVFPAFMAIAFFGGRLPEGAGWFFAALALLLAVGALDDRFNLQPRLKFLAQCVAAALAVIPGGTVIMDLGNLLGFGGIELGAAGALFTVIAVVLLINAMNLMDGLDGLASGIGLSVLALLALAMFVTSGSASGDLRLALTACGALAGFLVYNMRHPWRARASIFMGDAGSMALGLTLAWFCIRAAQPPAAGIVRPVTVAWLLALPVFDTCGQFVRRVARGRHPFDGDCGHFHHHFLYAGVAPGRAAAVIIALSGLSGRAGIAALYAGIPEYVLGWGWIALLLGHVYMSLRPHRFRRLIRKCFKIQSL